MILEAKPTTYKGIRFRSRLEAGWAVFWQSLSESRPLSWSYEDFGDVRGISLDGLASHFSKQEYKAAELQSVDQYVPDFRIAHAGQDGTGKPMIIFQEVKPVFPNQEFLDTLLRVSYVIGLNGYWLILSIGGFRDDKLPQIYSFPYNNYFSECLTSWVQDCDEAMRTAKNFRWDLHQED